MKFNKQGLIIHAVPVLLLLSVLAIAVGLGRGLLMETNTRLIWLGIALLFALMTAALAMLRNFQVHSWYGIVAFGAVCLGPMLFCNWKITEIIEKSGDQQLAQIGIIAVAALFGGLIVTLSGKGSEVNDGAFDEKTRRNTRETKAEPNRERERKFNF